MLCSALQARRLAQLSSDAFANRSNIRRSGEFNVDCDCSNASTGKRHADPGEMIVAQVMPWSLARTRFHSMTPRWPTVSTEVGRCVSVLSVHDQAKASIGK